MFLPLGDSPNPPTIPYGTIGLIVANVLVYVLVTLPLSATGIDPNDPLVLEYLRVLAEASGRSVDVGRSLREMSAYDLFVFKWGFRPAAPSFLTLFASLFLHGGFAHLFGNMLFLWIYGDNVEYRLGRPRFLISYLATGVAATLFHAFFDPASNLPLVGASGAISGVLGFYFLWFPDNVVRMAVFLFPFIMDTVRIRARWLLGAYLVLDNFFPFVLSFNRTSGGVAYGAHIGGFVGGLILAKLLRVRNPPNPRLETFEVRPI